MGRKPTKNLQLPPSMRIRRRGDRVYYYYDHGGKPRRETPLGSDYVEAVQKWAKLHVAPAPVNFTVGYAITQYLASPNFARLGSGTQDDYRFALDKLIENFAAARLEEVKPSHIQKYIDFRTRGDEKTKGSEHRALREVAILGMIYRFAMARDWTTTNPVAPIKRRKLPGRQDVYTEDDVLVAVYQHASPGLKDAIDIAYFAGQRPIDCLRMTEDSIKDLELAIKQTKRGARVRLPIAGGLETVIDRIIARKRGFEIQVDALLIDERGRPMTKAKLRSRFEAAREAAGEIAKGFQFRDLRAKSATDIREERSLDAAQALLGHSSVTMTEHYTRNRKGKLANTPTAKWKETK